MSEHEHEHTHGHTHSHEHTHAVSNRLGRAIGHLEAVRKMVEDGRDCSEVLIQLAAVRSALASVSRIILKDHMEHCIVDAIEQNDQTAMEELERAIDRLIK
ncbi:MAG: metal-sensing transcriptional repressor [Ruminococcaceae bacterium]|nr:metal-sensing transcriptional repressor [Oscillospiraceae bacterium]